jgi:tRNA pseudouridine32 synthase/23S rRNA pseudouridine746 synthase
MKTLEAKSSRMVCAESGMEANGFMAGLSGLIHVDASLVVVDKPAGLLSVPGRGDDKQDCLSARVQRVYADAQVVHRLDMATSGLFVMARGAATQRALSIAFAGREVRKRYVAVVDAIVEAGEGSVDLPLTADWPNRPKQKVDFERGKPSRTLYRVLAREGDATRLELEPVTGRSHQLRVHLMSIGHPILGDALYAPPAVRDRAPRLMLHATTLEFAHPATGERVGFASAPPF